MTYSIERLNQMSQEEFVAALGTVFERSPSISEKAWDDRPFADRDALYRSMVRIVQTSSHEEQLALFCAHPDLGTKAKMADASEEEQSGVGLDRLSPEEFERFQGLNELYRDRFGFPFIIAVKNQTKESILEAFEERLNHSMEEEQQQALTEICTIARFRLESMIE